MAGALAPEQAVSMRRIATLLLTLALLCAASIASGDLAGRAPEPPSQPQPDCGGDRVAGIWRGRNSVAGRTYLTTLRIERVRGRPRALTGRMRVTVFTGDRAPPPCYLGQRAYEVTQPANGTNDGLRVDFRGFAYRIERVICGERPPIYHPDHFTGTLDASAPILRMVNNDGVTEVNAPVMFRRARCL
jgi:hypothetical protein